MAEILCANRTVVRSAARYLGLPGPAGSWVAHCIACGHVRVGNTWREAYDWADEHSSRGWSERRWIPHTMTFTAGPSGPEGETEGGGR